MSAILTGHPIFNAVERPKQASWFSPSCEQERYLSAAPIFLWRNEKRDGL